MVGLRSFALDAKADIAAFVAEHGVAGALRASFLGAKAGLHFSASSEASSIRQPAALLSYAAKAHPLLEKPVAVAVDSATGGLPDASKATPWVLAVVDGPSHVEARQFLGDLGLAPAEFTLAAPIQLGAVAASLSAGETALVVMPGDNEAALAWVTAQGVSGVATAPMGYAAIYEAVQLGLGLKFKAAAGKLLYNENYDFTEAGPKIGATLAEALRPALAGKSGAGLLHVTGLTGSQPWLVEALAKSLGLGVWAPSVDKLCAGLEAGDARITTSAAGVLRMAAQGSGDAPWVQAPLDVILERRASPVSQAAAVAAPAPVASPASQPVAKPSAVAPVRPVQVSAKPAAKATAPAKPSARPAAEPALAAVDSVSVQESAPAAVSVSKKKSNKGPLLIASGVGVVAALVGLAMHFRSPAPRPEAKTETPAAVDQTAPAAAQPAAGPVAVTNPTPPAISSVPAPAPMVIPVASSASTENSADIFGADARKFGNERYRFEVTEKGFIQALATSREEVLVESAAGISLQGSYVGTDGRRKWFNVGGVDDAGYQAVVRKTLRDGITVFDVKVTHPRFELTQTFECLPETIKVGVKFTPINLRDPRGVIAAVHSVRLSPVALNPSLRMRATADTFAYAMKTGTLRVGFDASNWARDGADGRQTIIAGENGVAFHFTDGGSASGNMLSYEISVP